MNRKTNLITRIRRYWKIKPFNRIRTSKKLYNRKKVKRELKRRYNDEV